MTRGTTPTHVFTVDPQILSGGVSAVFITYAQNGRVMIEKETQDVVVGENTLTVKLTQDDTLKLYAPSSDTEVEIQIRIKTNSGEALASNVILTTVSDVLKDGAI